MKILHIALKDLLQQARSVPALVLTLVAPLVITGIIGLAFGGIFSDEPSLALMPVQVVNLDEGIELPGQRRTNLGQVLVDTLQSDPLAELVEVTVATDEAGARAAVDAGQAATAILIPADLSAVAFGEEGPTTITLYSDPTLTIGPGIVRGVVEQFANTLTGSRIAAAVTAQQLVERGLAVGPELSQIVGQVAQEYSQRAIAEPLVRLVQTAPAQTATEGGSFERLFALIVAGMLVFFVLFNGANKARTILDEEHEGTLARLFTTPTPRSEVLGGKFLAVLLTLVVQSVILMIAGRLLFGVDWGDPLAAALVAVALIVAATGLGVFFISLVKTSQQAGALMGGVLTILGMVGGNFSAAIPNLPSVFETIKLFTPHGWAMEGWEAVLQGGGLGDVLLPVAVLVGMGVVFFAVGALIFRRRFA